jgi:hypothetical protein
LQERFARILSPFSGSRPNNFPPFKEGNNMTDEENIQKSLAKIKSDEKGWRKALATAEGSFSRNLAEENLSRLVTLRHTLLNQLKTIELRRKHVMKVAVVDGIFTDHLSDGVCQQLVREGWLERADPIPQRPHISRNPAYLPTEKAIQSWQVGDLTEEE